MFHTGRQYSIAGIKWDQVGSRMLSRVVDRIIREPLYTIYNHVIKILAAGTMEVVSGH